jgi:AcrR family transcriptional regulator
MTGKPDRFFDSVWMRPPRSRAGQPTLSRDQSVRVAIELLDADGAAGLSMRRLGTRLGSGATSIYWYVANKEELLELAVDEVMGEIYGPHSVDTSWRIGATVLVTGMRDVLLRHPWVLGLLGDKPTIGPNAMRFGERLVTLLTAAGFTGMEVAHVSTTLTAYAIGTATSGSAVISATRRSGLTPAELIQKIEPYMEQSGSGHSTYDTWRRENMSGYLDPERMWAESFDFGLERMLDGLELWLHSGKPAAEAARADGG